MEAEEKMRSLEKENAIVKKSNEDLLDSAYSLEREREFQATENALKVQIAKLEATLKADLNDQRSLQVRGLFCCLKIPIVFLLWS